VRLKWRGREIEIRELGQGPALLLIHGYPLDGAMWSAVSRRLSDRFRVLKPDLPGRPDNLAEPDGSIESYADFIQSVAAAAGEPFGLVGFSMGGYVALALMKRRPEAVRALALVDTRAVADDEATRAKRVEAIATLQAEGVEPIAESMLGKLLAPASLARRELVDRVRRIILRQKADTLKSDLLAMRDRADSTELLREIAVPTLVVVGEHDVISPQAECEMMAKAIPNAKLVTIPGAGHLTPMETPGSVAESLGGFFASSL
jgi:pimeloyl-ACP methyl ester carboxylesterase